MEILSKILFRLRLSIMSLANFLMPGNNLEIINNFHELYYDQGHEGKTWGSAKYFGYPVQKFPGELLTYQEIIFELKPDLIIETGTAYGGTSLFMAHICDQLDFGEIVTVDITKMGEPKTHPRIHYLLGSSIDQKIISQIDAIAKNKKTIIVILDSDHKKEHVLQELEIYKKYVNTGSYLIIEDTNVNGNPVFPEHGPGPMDALNAFLPFNTEFESDRTREKHLLTFNPKGYLKKIK